MSLLIDRESKNNSMWIFLPFSYMGKLHYAKASNSFLEKQTLNSVKGK
jgi:hypothetical protein